MNGEPMKKLSIIFLLLTGCATAQPGTDPQTRIQEITFAGLVKFENETPTNCQSPDLKMSLRTAAYLTTQADILRTRQLTAGLILEIGDRALKKGCLDFAEEAYRTVIATFTGFGYVAHRQRAEIGLQDIRAARYAK